MGTYIGIDTESHIGHLTFSGSQLVDNLQLGDRLHIKAENVIIQPQIDFPISLAHPCKTILPVGKPALMAARISPPLTQSAPKPFSRIMASTLDWHWPSQHNAPNSCHIGQLPYGCTKVCRARPLCRSNRREYAIRGIYG